MATLYDRAELAAAVASSTSWAGALRLLGVKESGGARRALQRQAHAHGLDTGHLTRRASRLTYSDEALAAAVAASGTLREVAVSLGARPAPGTLSHLRRRIDAAGLDTGHLPGLHRGRVHLPYTRDELEAAAAASTSVRATARTLGVPDDGRSRAALRRALIEQKVDISHFAHRRLAVDEDALRTAVARATSYAGVMRELGLPVHDANHRRVQRQAQRLGLDTGHFTRPSRRAFRPSAPRRSAEEVLRRRAPGSGRAGRERLHRALDEIGVPYRCAGCGNGGEWQGRSMTLQIDHIDGDWLNDCRTNLRYLCPNCHAITDTWCGRNRAERHRPA